MAEGIHATFIPHVRKELERDSGALSELKFDWWA